MQGEGDIVEGCRVKGIVEGCRGHRGRVQGKGDIVGGSRVKGTLWEGAG